MTASLFLASPEAISGVGVGDLFTLTGDEGRHAATVQRLGVGEAVLIADGAGSGFAGTIASVGKGSLDVTVEALLAEPLPTAHFTLVQALGKGGRDELAVESATEIGVHEVLPWQAQRCVSVWKGEDRRDKGRRKWQQVAEAATKQSRRLAVPRVHELVDTRHLVRRVAAGEWDHVLVLHESASEAITRITLGNPATTRPLPAVTADPESGELTARGAVAPTRIALVVGPEGGISDDELEALSGAGEQVHVARLGPHVLRTSTAGPVALAVLASRGW